MINSPMVLSQSAQTAPHGDGTDFAVTQQPLIIQASGLVPDEIWLLEYSLIGENGWIPYTPRGQQLFMSTLRNPLVLATPGRYRLVFGEAPPLEEGETFTSAAEFIAIEASATHELLLAHVDPVVVTPGLAGPAGPAGGAGANGADGVIGPQGIAGPAGPDGPQGPIGADGPQGPIGPGGTGSVGPAGPAGADGAPGATGATGPAGASGAGFAFPLVAGDLTDNSTTGSQYGSQNLSAHNIRVAPYITNVSFSANQFEIERYGGGSAGSKLKIVLYESNGVNGWLPGTLLYQSPEIAVDVSGISNTALSPVISFVAGHLYWLGTHCSSNNVSVRSITNPSPNPYTMGVDPGSNVTSNQSFLQAAVAFVVGTPSTPSPGNSVFTLATRGQIQTSYARIRIRVA